LAGLLQAVPFGDADLLNRLGHAHRSSRVGLHAAEVELRGDNIGGIAVHTAARVQGCARPGEVYVSRTIVDLVAGSGIVFDDRGEHELKGISNPWQLFTVDASGGGTSAP
jgi:class 3 adenylate cyclase